MSVTVTKSKGFVAVTFQWDRGLIQAVKSVPGYEWNNGAKRWQFPMEPFIIRRLLETMKPHGLKVDPKLLAWLKEAETHDAEVEKALNDISPTLANDSSGKLYPYQKVGVNVLSTMGRGILGDEMGLGKTVQGIKIVEELEARGAIPEGEGPYLIVAPNAMKHTWAEEIDRWYSMSTEITVLNKCDEKELGDNPTGWFIINWDKIHLRIAQLQKVKWRVIIGDESHRMKNRQAKRSKAMVKIGRPVKYKFLLSGTPIRNDVPDLWNQLHFLYPERFTSYWRFVGRYMEIHENFFGQKEMVGLNHETEAELQKVLRTAYFGRKTEDVGLDLPSAVHKQITVDLSPRQQRVYDEMLEQFVTWIDEQEEDDSEAIKARNWMTQTLRLKQIAGSLGIFSEEFTDSAKLDALDELMSEAPGEKFVIMSQFQTMVEETCQRLQKNGVAYARMDGDHCEIWKPKTEEVPADNRQDLVNRFQMDEDVSVFIATTQTGGEGITLTAARYFVFLDLMWTPGDNDQAWKRIHRISQTRNCFIYSIIASGTIDQSAILPTLKKKKDIIKAVLRPGEDA